jgi:hypothetical protein
MTQEQYRQAMKQAESQHEVHDSRNPAARRRSRTRRAAGPGGR